MKKLFISSIIILLCITAAGCQAVPKDFDVDDAEQAIVNYYKFHFIYILSENIEFVEYDKNDKCAVFSVNKDYVNGLAPELYSDNFFVYRADDGTYYAHDKDGEYLPGASYRTKSADEKNANNF